MPAGCDGCCWAGGLWLPVEVLHAPCAIAASAHADHRSSVCRQGRPSGPLYHHACIPPAHQLPSLRATPTPSSSVTLWRASARGYRGQRAMNCTCPSRKSSGHLLSSSAMMVRMGESKAASCNFRKQGRLHHQQFRARSEGTEEENTLISALASHTRTSCSLPFRRRTNHYRHTPGKWRVTTGGQT